MEDFHRHQVEQAVADALRLGAISFDAVKMLLLARMENRPARLDLNFYRYLTAATVEARHEVERNETGEEERNAA